MRWMFLAGFVFFAAATALVADQVVVEFLNPCECHNNHGVYRWDVKTDQEAPPHQIPNDHKLKPSDIAAWPEPRTRITSHTPRSGQEKEWFQVTGKVVLAKAEADGDLHIQLVDEDKPDGVNVVVEVPVKHHPGISPWCDIRKMIFTRWSQTTFPFDVTSDKKIDLQKHPVIRVEGKAFFDATHKGRGAPPNRREGEPNVSIWEIHPVMVLEEM
jgi:hypothetical protein